MSVFTEAIQKATSTTLTENGAAAYASTLNAVLDFFANAGAMRGNIPQALSLFMSAFYTDHKLGLKALFHLRDVLEGNGERQLFREMAKWLAQNHPEDMKRNLVHIPTYGRWDDLYAFMDTPLEKDALEVLFTQFKQDMTALECDPTANISLVGKWLKSENASSEWSTKCAKRTAKYFNLSLPEYRKALTKLRERLDIIETDICKKAYGNIAYAHVPAQAMNKYKELFLKHDGERFKAYLAAVAKAEAKINAKTLAPHEIIGKYLDDIETLDGKEDEINAIQALWNALPNYADGSSTMVVADVSGSMTCGKPGQRPIDVCIALAMYFAERSTGPFKDTFMTFSTEPELVKLTGQNVVERMRTLSHAKWMMSTDIYRVFKLILKVAQDNKLTEDDMPKRIVIISDMEFNRATPEVSQEVFDMIDNDYKAANYKRPLLIFWNVNARHQVYPVTKMDRGAVLVSGNSTAAFRYVLNADENATPINLMLEVLNGERYKCIE